MGMTAAFTHNANIKLAGHHSKTWSLTLTSEDYKDLQDCRSQVALEMTGLMMRVPQLSMLAYYNLIMEKKLTMKQIWISILNKWSVKEGLTLCLTSMTKMRRRKLKTLLTVSEELYLTLINNRNNHQEIILHYNTWWKCTIILKRIQSKLIEHSTPEQLNLQPEELAPVLLVNPLRWIMNHSIIPFRAKLSNN